MIRDPYPVGECPGCRKPVMSGQGVRIDPEGGVWHPSCRLSRHKTAAGDLPASDAPKRRGRPPKQRLETQ